MKRSLTVTAAFFVLASSILIFSCSQKRSDRPRILVFSKTEGYHHASIEDGNLAIQKLGLENNFDVDTTTDAAMFREDTLKKYSAIVFLSTTGNVLNNFQEAAFERYIQAGGGYMGIHAAADCEYDWGWYGRLAGAYFISHPGINDTFPNIQTGVLHVKDADSKATKDLPEEWKRTDEFYSFKKISNDIHVVLTIDEKSYNGGVNGENHPMAWQHEYDGGRAFYTNLGHTKESFTEDLYLKHILGGIQYAIGDNKAPDYSKTTTQIPPDDNRFTKTQLVQGEFFEPTEMTVLPNLDILVIQRRGEIYLYKNSTKTLKQVGFLDVYYKTLNTPGVNAEEGMLGLSKDPNFKKNNWIYIYYSPADTAVNRLSRFTFKNDTLDKATETVILEVKSQREICCHTGGSIAFGPDGLMYFSSGDNSTPFNEKGEPFVNNGFAPLNDMPGHEQYDARRSAGNTNDLRGKIMRIKMNDDGSYEIPEGNLFSKGTDKTRPEIYVMGNRNPYRISVDQKNSYLYWGEVGPDAANDSLQTRGPRGYDEVNQARKAGFFGWPLFVGNNFAYRSFDYSTGKSGAAFDPAKPVNDSRNNTGLRDLPPAQPAFIWYPYAASQDFPQVGTGGRNAMAGPVYYTDMYPAETRLPNYYNGKLIIYEWIRGWIKAVTLRENGDFDKMEPFFGSIKLNNLIDMEVGPDGKLYLLEYGTGWFSKNPDAGLSRIDFNGGNRPPVISSITADRNSGVLPFEVNLKANANDLENDKITYTWNFGDGSSQETENPQVSHTYTKPGDFKITMIAKDSREASSTSEAISVYAGNEAPQVDINIIGGNKSFYIPGTPVQYAVTVTDKSDTSKYDPSNLYVSVDYVEGFDQAGSSMGHQQGVASISGRNIMLSLDCKSCHKEEEKSIGPSYKQVSEKYAKDSKAMSYLSEKIIKGGSGVWGEVAMAAHPTLSQSEANQIVSWILSLNNPASVKKSLPAEGKINPPASAGGGGMAQKPAPVLVLSASYTDKGGNNIKALSGNKSIALRSNTVPFTGNENKKEFGTIKYNGTNIMNFPATEGWFSLDSIDLRGVNSITLMSGWQSPPKEALDFEIRLDRPDGKLLGKGSSGSIPKGQMYGMINVPVEAVTDGRLHNIYFINKPKETVSGGIVSVQFNGK
ncbi:hypothetical protein BH20BAC1_BH20BAC1_02710 [soil metagenome]